MPARAEDELALGVSTDVLAGYPQIAQTSQIAQGGI
jgi:hypothetical protein